MAATAKNIIVGAAKVYISYGTNSYRPSMNSSSVFPWTVTGGTGSNVNSASGKSTVSFLNTASGYWRDFGFTSTGVDISYEPGYSDVVVDQLLDAARLFQQSLKVIIKTELDEGLFENMNIVWGQQEQFINVGAGASTTYAITGGSVSTLTGAASAAAVTQLAMAAGALGIQPVERSLVFVGTAPGSYGRYNTGNPVSASTAITPVALNDTSSNAKKERVYVARRVIQEQTTAHALKRDAATVFPVSFRALPDTDGVIGGSSDDPAGTEYGFIIDRVYG